MFDTVKRMHTTVTLDPYEREVLYGYPFVIGRRDGNSIQGTPANHPVERGTEETVSALQAMTRPSASNALPFQVDSQEKPELLQPARKRVA